MKEKFGAKCWRKIACCGCICAEAQQDREVSNASATKVQILLDALQEQAQQHETSNQLREALQCLTTVLEGLSKVVTIPHSSNDDDTSVRASETEPSCAHLALQRNNNNNDQSRIYPIRGTFGRSRISFRLSLDKAVQSTTTDTAFGQKSELIQTQQARCVVNYATGLDLTDFKLQLIRHIRDLRRDVVTLRQLTFCSVNRNLNVERIVRKTDRIDGGNGRFSVARTRATHFATFYRLQNKKSNRKNRPCLNVQLGVDGAK